MNVFKVLEGTVPSSVESRIIAFLGCLSAQQSFILRVMSVIGTRGIEAELVEVRPFEPFNAYNKFLWHVVGFFRKENIKLK